MNHPDLIYIVIIVSLIWVIGLTSLFILFVQERCGELEKEVKELKQMLKDALRGEECS